MTVTLHNAFSRLHMLFVVIHTFRLSSMSKRGRSRAHHATNCILITYLEGTTSYLSLHLLVSETARNVRTQSRRILVKSCAGTDTLLVSTPQDGAEEEFCTSTSTLPTRMAAGAKEATRTLSVPDIRQVQEESSPKADAHVLEFVEEHLACLTTGNSHILVAKDPRTQKAYATLR